MKRAHLYTLVAVLVLVAAALFFYKVIHLGFPLKPEEKSEIWRVEVQIRFDATGGPVKAALQLPTDTGQSIIIDQNFVSRGYGLTTESDRGGQRAIYSIGEAQGSQTLYYRATIHRVRSEETSRESVPEITPPRLAGAELEAATAIVDAVRRQSADGTTMAALIVKRLKEAQAGDEASLLLGRSPSNPRLVNMAVDLLLMAQVPARVVNGLALEPERRHAGFVHWLEVYDKGFWKPIYPGEARARVRQHYLPWWRGKTPFIGVEGAANVVYDVATSRSYELSMQTALNQQRKQEQRLIEFSLFGLPLQTQALYRTILVIPVGILLLVFLRNVIGVKTFGTFMPVLIAIAFRQTGVVWGVVFFSIIVALGLSVRFYLERLKLLLVPRLASVVIVVVLILAMLSVISYKLGFDRGLSVGLFPIVILTMTIERMTVVWEERGAGEALQQAVGSLLVGIMCYLVMHLSYVEHLAFVFPELLLIVLGGTLLLGRYAGYRLVELPRFKVLADK